MALYAVRSRSWWQRACLYASAASLFVCALAHADKVHLKSGSVLEGKVSREGDKIVVQLESGSIRLDAASVTRVERAETALERIQRRRAALAADAVDERIELANLCRDAQLLSSERALLEEVIARVPDHAEARRRLGYVRGEDGWISRAERAEQREHASRIEREARARERAQAEILRETAELERKQAELALERERVALQKAELERTPVPLWYAPYWGPHVWRPHAVRPPHAAPPMKPYVINGVRMPSEVGLDIPGMRPPASYFR